MKGRNYRVKDEAAVWDRSGLQCSTSKAGHMTALKIESPSAIIAVGTATLGALVGAGGFGQPILTGIRLADTGLLLEGALPAAALALAVEAAFDGLERLVVPRGLRLGPEQPG